MCSNIYTKNGYLDYNFIFSWLSRETTDDGNLEIFSHYIYNINI